MVPPEVGPDLFDFGDVAKNLDLRTRQEEYYRSLLKEREIAEKAFLDQQKDATPEAIDAALDESLRSKPVTGGTRIVLDAWVRRGYHGMTKLLPLGIVAALAMGGVMWSASSEERKQAAIERQQVVIASATKRVDTLYNSVLETGCPQDALASAKDLYADFRSARTSGNLERITQIGNGLESFSNQLLARGEMRVLGGIWTYKEGKPNNPAYYLKVQLVSNEPVWLPIKDDARGGAVSMTPRWGEEVSESVYNAVGADAQDNGVINNAVMGRKDRCSMDISYDYRVRITDGSTFHMTKSYSRLVPLHPKGDLNNDDNWVPQ